MLVVAGEGFDETLDLIRAGDKGLTAEGGAFDQSGWFPWEVADEINRFFNGEKSVPEGLGFTAIDADHNMPPDGQNYEAEVDYRKGYEKVWNGE